MDLARSDKLSEREANEVSKQMEFSIEGWRIIQLIECSYAPYVSDQKCRTIDAWWQPF